MHVCRYLVLSIKKRGFDAVVGAESTAALTPAALTVWLEPPSRTV